jgi:hypothetical protein
MITPDGRSSQFMADYYYPVNYDIDITNKSLHPLFTKGSMTRRGGEGIINPKKCI